MKDKITVTKIKDEKGVGMMIHVPDIGAEGTAMDVPIGLVLSSRGLHTMDPEVVKRAEALVNEFVALEDELADFTAPMARACDKTAEWLAELVWDGTEPPGDDTGEYRIKRSDVEAKFSMFCNAEGENDLPPFRTAYLDIICSLGADDYCISVTEWGSYLYVIPLGDGSDFRTPPRKMMFPEPDKEES